MCQRRPGGCVCRQLHVLDGYSGDGEGGGTSPGLLLRLGFSHLHLQLCVLPSCGGHAQHAPSVLTGRGITGLTLLFCTHWSYCPLWFCHTYPLPDEEPVGLSGLCLF